LINELVDNLPSTILGNCISEKITSGHSPAATKEDTGHSLLTLSALSKYGFLNGREKPTQNIQEVRRYTIRKGDVLISRSNTRELVGLAGVVEEDSDNLSFPDLMFRVRVDQSKLLPYFLEVILLSNIGRRYMMSNAQGTSGSMKKINTKMLVSMPIPIVPIQEQRKISDIRVLLKQSFDFLNEGPSSPIESMLGVMRMTLAQLFPEAN
jgi:restriction endonuclease S subunit